MPADACAATAALLGMQGAAHAIPGSMGISDVDASTIHCYAICTCADKCDA